jgi:hypothetical protein
MSQWFKVDLNPTQRRALIAGGFTPAQILAFQQGRTTDPRMQSIIQGGTNVARMPTPATGYPMPAHSIMEGVINNAYKQAGYTPQTTAPNLKPRWTPPTGVAPDDTSAPKPSGNGTLWNDFGGTLGGGGGADGFPTAPAIPDVKIPVITPHDFLPQATTATGKAWQPVLSQLDKTKANVGAEGERSRKIVGGLWDNMKKAIASQAVENKNSFADASKDSQTTGSQLASQIGKNYQGANANTADLLSKINGGQAAGSILGQGANDQGWQQGLAAINANANKSFFDKEGAAQAAADRQYGSIAQGQGNTAQADILNQVSNQLLGVDTSIADQQQQRGMAAINMAQQLSGQDLSSQNSNAGFTMQGQGMQSANAQTAYQNSRDAYNAARDAQQQAIQNALVVAQRQQDQANADRIFQAANPPWSGAVGENTPVTGTGTTGTGSSTTAQPKPSAVQAIQTDIISRYPQQGQTMYNDAVAAMQSLGSGNDPNSKRIFLEEMKKRAIAGNYAPQDAMDVGMRLWNGIYGT